ncbi:DeoR family transcriptional regulator [candidate division KSB3 bacterium]|uniref:DeoR family transcriptional regulator n=1 Tax=candidate division KSB3 bacterium TaxID=2044937 RepID=A0A9D5K0F6_9BACT|nr:DeoR family transcriptional regulator [candidate division KSB3 bacterium]MBD3327498.1 DeoR family transcriptional regulator [candidate division KSB3 bacterium]
MDKSLFTDNALGNLVRVAIQGGYDWAFVPYSLPREWKIPLDVWPLLAEAREELARLDGIGRHMPNYELLLRPLQQREALRSSSLEGTYATPEQLLLYEIDPKEPKSHFDPVNAWREVLNYSNALRLGQRMLQDIPVSLRLIKRLHQELLDGVRGYHRNPGEFRRSQVHIGSDRRFVPPPPLDAMKCLQELELYIHQEHTLDPLIFCFMVHYQFEAIHPFLDGNGRVGRLLLSLMIYQWCQLTSPWLYVSAFFDKYKDEYIRLLFRVSTHGKWKDWIMYCLRATAYQAKDAILRCDKLVALRDKYFRAVTEHRWSTGLHRIIEQLFVSPMITIPQVSNMLDISYPTARKDIDHLVKANILVKAEIQQRPKVFLAPEIIQMAYSDLDLMEEERVSP